MSALSGIALRLHGPMQAWGGPVIGDNRPTLSFPTKSGVLGIVACAMGILRGEVARLVALAEGTKVHVRVDAPGVPFVDDQTIQDNPIASSTRQTIQSKRTYLADASFVAIIVPGPHTSIEDIGEALARPAFTLSLGRRTCVPSTPILLAREVQGADPIDLFASLPLGPAELIEQSFAARAPIDYYLDIDEHPRRLRRLPVRDTLAGPLPRQFRERLLVHVRQPRERTAPTSDPWSTSDLT